MVRSNQLVSTGRKKGGTVTKSQSILRQSYVEKFMLKGYGVTKIASLKINNKKLGALDTISKDMDIIRSRWLDKDPEWFHRARLARIEAAQQLRQQLIRMNELIVELLDGKQNNKLFNTQEGIVSEETNEDLSKKLISAEATLTKIIISLYEIDADFDPEQYIDKKIQESINVKIKETTSAIS